MMQQLAAPLLFADRPLPPPLLPLNSDLPRRQEKFAHPRFHGVVLAALRALEASLHLGVQCHFSCFLRLACVL